MRPGEKKISEWFLLRCPLHCQPDGPNSGGVTGALCVHSCARNVTGAGHYLPTGKRRCSICAVDRQLLHEFEPRSRDPHSESAAELLSARGAPHPAQARFAFDALPPILSFLIFSAFIFLFFYLVNAPPQNPKSRRRVYVTTRYVRISLAPGGRRVMHITAPRRTPK